MSTKEQREYARLSKLWATGRATRSQVMRCLELDKKKDGTSARVAIAAFRDLEYRATHREAQGE